MLVLMQRQRRQNDWRVELQRGFEQQLPELLVVLAQLAHPATDERVPLDGARPVVALQLVAQSVGHKQLLAGLNLAPSDQAAH